MKAALILVVSGMFIGCASVQENGVQTAHGWIVVEDIPAGTHVFHNNIQAGAVKQCSGKWTSEEMASLRQYDEGHSWFYNCSYIVTPQLVSGPSLATQLQGPVSAAILGAGIGTGLALSGDDTTNNNTNSANGGNVTRQNRSRHRR